MQRPDDSIAMCLIGIGMPIYGIAFLVGAVFFGSAICALLSVLVSVALVRMARDADYVIWWTVDIAALSMDLARHVEASRALSLHQGKP